MRRWFGLKTLVHEAISATTDLVREGNDSAARLVLRVTDQIPLIAEPARQIEGIRRATAMVTLGSVVAVNRVVEALTDLALHVSLKDLDGDEGPVPMRSDVIGTAGWVADASLGVINGAIGDQLASRGNGLDLGLALRYRDRLLGPAEVPAGGVSSRIVILVHGLGVTEWSWCLDAAAYHGDPAAHFGGMLERDLGLTPIFVRYNTGRAISASGRALSLAIEGLVDSWPVPVDEIILLGHSMGGLVARSACAQARLSGHAWLSHLRTVISLGSPHQGSPLAGFAEAAVTVLGALDHPATLVLSRLLDARSAGVKDLRLGDLGGDGEAVLLDDVRYVFLSGLVTADATHPVGAFMGDLLVRVPSASGPQLRTDQFSIRTGTFGGVLHHQLQCHPDVYAEVRRACSPTVQ